MIVCHCNVIAAREIEELVHRLSAVQPHAIVTPGMVFAGCGKRPSCGGCMPMVVASVAVARTNWAEKARVRTLMTDPGGVAGVEVAPVGPAANETRREGVYAGDRCTSSAIAPATPNARGARR